MASCIGCFRAMATRAYLINPNVLISYMLLLTLSQRDTNTSPISKCPRIPVLKNTGAATWLWLELLVGPLVNHTWAWILFPMMHRLFSGWRSGCLQQCTTHTTDKKQHNTEQPASRTPSKTKVAHITLVLPRAGGGGRYSQCRQTKTIQTFSHLSVTLPIVSSIANDFLLRPLTHYFAP